MNTATNSFSGAAMALAALSSVANAEPGLYYGIGIGISSAESFQSAIPVPGTDNSGTLGSVVLTFGNRFEGDAIFYGIEANADISVFGDLKNSGGIACDDGSASGPYFCEQTAAVRIRGMLGTDLSDTGYEVFGTLGYAAMYGDGAIAASGAADSGAIGGLTYGIGVQRETASGAIFRAELIHDKPENNISMPAGIFAPSWEATSISLSYIKGF